MTLIIKPILIVVGVFVLLGMLRCRRCVIIPLIVIGMIAAMRFWSSRVPMPVRVTAVQVPTSPGYQLPAAELRQAATANAPWVLESVQELIPATHPTGKLWVDDWAAYVSSERAGRRTIRAESPQYAPTDDEARASAQENAVQLLIPYISSRVPDQRGIIALVPNSPHAATDPRLASLIQAALRGPGGLILDEQLERVDRPYGQLWRARLLVDGSSARIDRFVADYNRQVASSQQREIGTWASLAIMLAIVVLLYAFLNAATKGYFVWKLRAAAAMIVIVALLVAASNLRM